MVWVLKDNFACTYTSQVPFSQKIEARYFLKQYLHAQIGKNFEYGHYVSFLLLNLAFELYRETFMNRHST